VPPRRSVLVHHDVDRARMIEKRLIVASATGWRLIAPFPIDDIPERPAVEIGAQIGAEEIDGAVTVLITGSRDMRGDQYLGIGPEPHHRRVLEFTDIDIERRAAQMIALERIGQGVFVAAQP
jgi:hypothetical protein